MEQEMMNMDGSGVKDGNTVNGTRVVRSASVSQAGSQLGSQIGGNDELARNDDIKIHGDIGNTGNDDLQQHIHQSQLSKDSKNILSKMDIDNDGIVTYNDAAIYGKRKKAEKRKWKLLFIIAILLLLITYAVIFGLFLLGFNLTKTLDVDSSSDGNNALIASDTGEYVSTLQGAREVNISSILDSGNSIDKISGFFGNRYFSVDISTMIIDYDDEYGYYLTLYDNSGKIEINYFYNVSDYYVLYQTLPNGTIVGYNNIVSNSNSNSSTAGAGAGAGAGARRRMGSLPVADLIPSEAIQDQPKEELKLLDLTSDIVNEVDNSPPSLGSR